MRINARLDEESQQQIDYLVTTTGQSLSQVVRESVSLYYAQVRAGRAGLKHLGALVGTGHSGRNDVASNHKQHLTEILEAKHGLRRR